MNRKMVMYLTSVTDCELVKSSETLWLEVDLKAGLSLACRLPQMAAKPRLLVCAPSNAAADELLQRVMTAGFIGNDNNVYFPNVVRYALLSHLVARLCSIERNSA